MRDVLANGTVTVTPHARLRRAHLNAKVHTVRNITESLELKRIGKIIHPYLWVHAREPISEHAIAALHRHPAKNMWHVHPTLNVEPLERCEARAGEDVVKCRYACELLRIYAHPIRGEKYEGQVGQTAGNDGG